jgi:hypothetical protein
VDHRAERDVRHGHAVAGNIGPVGQVCLQNVQRLDQRLVAGRDETGVATPRLGAHDGPEQRDALRIGRRLAPFHPLIGDRALGLAVGQQAALAVAPAEIPHDRVRFPENEALVVDGRDQPIGIHRQIVRPIEAAERPAHVVAAMGQAQLADRPHDGDHVARVASAPDFQHFDSLPARAAAQAACARYPR